MAIVQILIILTSVFLSNCGPPATSVHEGAEIAVQPKRQAWVISPAEGTIRTYCVSLSGDVEKALDTLRATGEGLEILEDPVFGSAVCKIGDTGWPVSTCFGTGISDPSWIYFSFNRENGEWEALNVAVNNLEVHDGDLLAFLFTGYTWDGVSMNYLRRPPEVTFDEVCQEN